MLLKSLKVKTPKIFKLPEDGVNIKTLQNFS